MGVGSGLSASELTKGLADIDANPILFDDRGYEDGGAVWTVSCLRGSSPDFLGALLHTRLRYISVSCWSRLQFRTSRMPAAELVQTNPRPRIHFWCYPRDSLYLCVLSEVGSAAMWQRPQVNGGPQCRRFPTVRFYWSGEQIGRAGFRQRRMAPEW